MVDLEQVEKQLKKLGCNFRMWGRPELKELCKILFPNEIIAQCLNIHYQNGFALLCATNERLLLIDKKPMFLTVEDIRFEMIAQLDYSAQVFASTLRIMTPGRNLTFTAMNHARLRSVFTHVQQRVTDIRHYVHQQFKTVDRYGSILTSAVGGLALGSNPASLLNPYINTPLLISHRRVPKFY